MSAANADLAGPGVEGRRAGPEALVLDLNGFEGPIDVLLALARDQKVDLARISILQLADQYLAFVAEARRIRLELAADYLVMAAWLAYLKSRMLLPEPDPPEGETAEDMAQALAFQLQRLEAMRDVAAKLFARPQLGRDVFARGAPEIPERAERTVVDVSLYDLLRAYADVRRRKEADRDYTIPEWTLYSVEEALGRLRDIVGRLPDWSALASFLPPGLQDGLVGRSVLASTLVASLELAKEGRVEIRQDGAFQPVWIRRKEA
ncbi:MAG TPA: ScpA family protein [Azospirillaceae bacterium]|nr:ScpA family protein [Azospirillaceae bacterium]